MFERLIIINIFLQYFQFRIVKKNKKNIRHKNIIENIGPQFNKNEEVENLLFKKVKKRKNKKTKILPYRFLFLVNLPIAQILFQY